MRTFTVKHKHCGYTKRIRGISVWDALKSNGLDYTIWEVVEVE